MSKYYDARERHVVTAMNQNTFIAYSTISCEQTRRTYNTCTTNSMFVNTRVRISAEDVPGAGRQYSRQRCR